MDSAEIKWLSKTFKEVEVFDGMTVAEMGDLIDQLEKYEFKKDDMIF